MDPGVASFKLQPIAELLCNLCSTIECKYAWSFVDVFFGRVALASCTNVVFFGCSCVCG